jgi:hypothetical protein
VIGEEDRVGNLDQEEYRPLWEMFQGPVLDYFRTRSLADLETPDSFLDLVRFG